MRNDLHDVSDHALLSALVDNELNSPCVISWIIMFDSAQVQAYPKTPVLHRKR